VEELRDALGFPGMRVLQFAFDGDPKNPHLPSQLPRELRRVYRHARQRHRIRLVGSGFGGGTSAGRGPDSRRRSEIHWALIRLVADSGANLAMLPAQDLLGLGSGARMNTPGTSAGNWSWRLRSMALLDPEVLRRLRGLTGESGRLSSLPVLHDSP
jgi:4-alpha-glucanotransferase